MGNIIPFPADRLVAEVERMALALVTKAKKEQRLADKYWRVECGRMESILQVRNVPRHEIDRQLRIFHDAVQAEVNLLIEEALAEKESSN